MRLARFGEPGTERPGIFDAHGILRDASTLVSDWRGKHLHPQRLAALARADLESLPAAPAGARLGPPVAGIGKIIGVGLNYADHAAEAGLALPPEPIWFLKATSSLSGPHDPILIPRGATKVDWEAELAVVIGAETSYATADRALKAIVGYTIINDVSERAFQTERGTQWTKGKSCDSFAPLGPWLTTADAIADPQALDIWLDVNGFRQQSSNTAHMIFDVVALIVSLSSYMTLHPGDVIATGTPHGVGFGQVPQRFLSEGDIVELGVAGLGEQRQTVIVHRPADMSCAS